MTTLLSRAPTSMRLMVTNPSPWIGPIHILSLRSPCHDLKRQKRGPRGTNFAACGIKHPVKRTAPAAVATIRTDPMNRRHFLTLGAATVSLASSSAWSQAYPTRPVRVIVTFAPGGPTDVAARLIAQKLSDSLGRQFVVENVAGASGNIGTVQAAKAAPDGYTLLITVNNLVINPPLFGNVTYDPYKDFDPVALAVSFSSALSVHPSVPAKSVSELVNHVKANPGKLSFASPGLGTPSHLLGEQFKVTLGLDLVHVPY